jgi:regulatory LuxR family protein
LNDGIPHKQIAAELATSETTVKIHRGQVMHKTQAQSVPGLVRMAAKLGLPGRPFIQGFAEPYIANLPVIQQKMRGSIARDDHPWAR